MNEMLARANAMSPLFKMALLKGTETSVLVHLRRGAPLDGRDDRGRTPLILAAAGGRQDICALLIAEGADPLQTDIDGKTAADHATVRGYISLAKLLVPFPVQITSDTTCLDTTVDEAGSTVWVAENDLVLGQTDTAMARSVGEAQSILTAHKSIIEVDAWSDAEIYLPRSVKILKGIVDRFPGLDRVVASILDAGWVEVDELERALAIANVGLRRVVREVLELAGIPVVSSPPWRSSRFVLHTAAAGAISNDDVDEVLALAESFLQDSISLVEKYEAKVCVTPIPSRDEEERLFKSLGAARVLIARTIKEHAAEFLRSAVDADEIHDAGEDVDEGEELDQSRPEGSPDESDLRDFNDRLAGWNGDAPTLTVPYGALVRLMDSARPQNDLNETAARQIGRSLDKFRHARDRIAIAFLPIVPRIAKFYHGRGVPLMDLIQEGNIGLLKSIEKFDVSLGNRFTTYAVWWVRQAIRRAIDDQSRTVRVPVHLCESLRKVDRYVSAQLSGTGKMPVAEEIIAQTEVSPRFVKMIQKALLERRRFDGRHVIDDAHLVQEARDPAFVQRVVESDQLARLISLALCKLKSPRDERVLRMRFGFGTNFDLTLEQVGADFSVTRERIRQIEAKALRRLQKSQLSREMRGFLVD